MQPRTNDTSMKRVKALSAALKFIFWDFIEKNFYPEYLAARHRQDINYAIYLISESNYRVSHSWFYWTKSCISSHGPLHRLPDLINFAELYEGLQRQINIIKNILNNMRDPGSAIDQTKFDKFKQELTDTLPILLGEISAIQKKLALKVKFSFNDTRYYDDADDDDIARQIAGYHAREGFIMEEPDVVRKHRELDRISSYYLEHNKTWLEYLDHGLLGMYGDKKLVSMINNKILDNKFINLPELIQSFNGWIDDQLNEIKLPHTVIQHSIFSATAPLKQKINCLSGEVNALKQDLQAKNDVLMTLNESLAAEKKYISMLIKQKDEISEQSSRLAVEKTQLQQRRKTRLTTSRNF